MDGMFFETFIIVAVSFLPNSGKGTVGKNVVKGETANKEKEREKLRVQKSAKGRERRN